MAMMSAINFEKKGVDASAEQQQLLSKAILADELNMWNNGTSFRREIWTNTDG